MHREKSWRRYKAMYPGDNLYLCAGSDQVEKMFSRFAKYWGGKQLAYTFVVLGIEWEGQVCSRNQKNSGLKAGG